MIAGVAESDLGSVPAGTTPVDLIGQAAARALADCGLTPADVDVARGPVTSVPVPVPGTAVNRRLL